MPVHQKKRKFEMGRQPTMTKMGEKTVRAVRGRGGNLKFRALRIDTGNFSWGSEGVAKKTRILDVVYNATNNELTRTKTLVKNCVVLIDAHPFLSWYTQHYGVELGKKKEGQETPKVSRHVAAKRNGRAQNRVIDPIVAEQFNAGRLFACLSSRPGQSGRADGYILEGKELEFYKRKLEKRKHK